MNEKTPKDTSKKRNLISLLGGALFRPKTTFSYLKDNRRKSWWFAAFVILLLLLAPTIIAGMQPASMPPELMNNPQMMPGEVGKVEAYEGEVYSESDVMAGGPGMPTQAPGAGGPNILALIGTVLGTPLTWLLWGGALYLTSVFLGRSRGFREMFRLAVWGWLPYAMRGLVQGVYIALTGEAIVNAGLSGFVQSPMPGIIPLGPGRLILASALSNIDIYTLWHLLVTSTGLAAHTQLPLKKTHLATLSIWLAWVLLGSIPAVVGGMFGLAG